METIIDMTTTGTPRLAKFEIFYSEPMPKGTKILNLAITTEDTAVKKYNCFANVKIVNGNNNVPILALGNGTVSYAESMNLKTYYVTQEGDKIQFAMLNTVSSKFRASVYNGGKAA